MRRAGSILVGLAVAAAACRHAQRAGPPAGQASGAAAPGGGSQGGGVPPAPGRPAAPASPAGLLSREATVELQRKLAARGLLGAHREGELDAATSTALERFQERNGLASTGFPDQATLERLGIDPEKAYAKAKETRPAAEPGQGSGGR